MEERRGSKTIRVSEELYNEIFDMGVGWKTSFNDVLQDVIKQAKTNNKRADSAAGALDKDTNKEE